MKDLEKLYAVLQERKQADPSSSYVASLYSGAVDKIAKKIGEEATEVILASKNAQQNGNKEDLIYEMADLWFHNLVMLSFFDIKLQQITDELNRRFGISGHIEKANRN